MTWSVLIEQLVNVMAATASVVAALVPVLVPTAPLWLPLVANHIKDVHHRQAFTAVSNAGLLALNAASVEYRAAIARAKEPSSPGGTEVMAEEKQAALTAGISVGMRWLKDQGVLQRVVDAYGGEDAARLALESIIRSKLSEPGAG